MDGGIHRHVWITVAGRRVKVASGAKCHTVNICDHRGPNGQCERVARLQVRSVEPYSLARAVLASVEYLVLHLITEYGGKEERRSGVASPLPPSVKIEQVVTTSAPTVTVDTNSNRTRLEPVFGWLSRNGAAAWCQGLLGLAEGLGDVLLVGECCQFTHITDVEIPANHARLAWMLRHADDLIALAARSRNPAEVAMSGVGSVSMSGQ
jgi:hypothetical protein